MDSAGRRFSSGRSAGESRRARRVELGPWSGGSRVPPRAAGMAADRGDVVRVARCDGSGASTQQVGGVVQVPAAVEAMARQRNAATTPVGFQHGIAGREAPGRRRDDTACPQPGGASAPMVVEPFRSAARRWDAAAGCPPWCGLGMRPAAHHWRQRVDPHVEDSTRNHPAKKFSCR